MSTSTSKSNKKKKTTKVSSSLEKINCNTRVPVKTTETFEQQVAFLCSRIKSKEWSGLVFFSYEGSIEDQDLSITAKEILPLNIGTTGHTEDEIDERLVEFLGNKDERVNLYWGLVHSHNNMGVFFSAEDMSELEDNARHHNFYLSIIVNNAGDICGKVAVYGEGETTFKHYYKVGREKKEIVYDMGSKETLAIYNCKFDRFQESDLDDEFMSFYSRMTKYTPSVSVQSSGSWTGSWQFPDSKVVGFDSSQKVVKFNQLGVPYFSASDVLKSMFRLRSNESISEINGLIGKKGYDYDELTTEDFFRFVEQSRDGKELNLQELEFLLRSIAWATNGQEGYLKSLGDEARFHLGRIKTKSWK